MNQGPSALLHVQLICLFVLMVYNVFINISSATGKLSVWTVLMNLKLSAALLSTFGKHGCSSQLLEVVLERPSRAPGAEGVGFCGPL